MTRGLYMYFFYRSSIFFIKMNFFHFFILTKLVKNGMLLPDETIDYVLLIKNLTK